MDKHSSFLQKSINYGRKKFHSTDSSLPRWSLTKKKWFITFSAGGLRRLTTWTRLVHPFFQFGLQNSYFVYLFRAALCSLLF